MKKFESILHLSSHLLEVVENSCGFEFHESVSDELVEKFEIAIDEYICSIEVEEYDDPLYLNGKISSFSSLLEGLMESALNATDIKEEIRALLVKNNMDSHPQAPTCWLNGRKAGNEEIFKLLRVTDVGSK